MSRLFDDASAHFLEIDSTPVTTTPFTMACWVRSNDVTILQQAMWIGDKDVEDHFYQLGLTGNTAGDPARFSAKAGGTTRHATTTTGYTANTWHHICGVAAAVDSRSVYIDGGSKATSTNSVGPAGEDRLSIGRAGKATPAQYFSGNIAEAAIWDVALSDAEVALLAKGVSPLMVQPGSLINYWSLIGKYSPEIDLVGGLNLAVTLATADEHTRIFYPPRSYMPLVTAVVGGVTIPIFEHHYRMLRAV